MTSPICIAQQFFPRLPPNNLSTNKPPPLYHPFYTSSKNPSEIYHLTGVYYKLQNEESYPRSTIRHLLETLLANDAEERPRSGAVANHAGIGSRAGLSFLTATLPRPWEQECTAR